MTPPAFTQVTIPRPDDWHVHFRDGAMLEAVVPFTARQFGRAIVMPNLTPPITTVEEALSYKARIQAAVPDGVSFDPLMTCYLTDTANADEISTGFKDGVFTAAKMYPANATTNSAAGVTDIANVHGVFERMQRDGMPLLIHGESTDQAVDVFDREAVFIDQVLSNLVQDFPDLKIVFEHVTTQEAVQFVRDRHAVRPGFIAATITVHHLMINRSDLFRGGMRPHLYCLPIAKREKHRLALCEAAISGPGPFFLGTDTAPHARPAKESACGCAGVFSAPVAMEAYTQVFDEEGALDQLAAFASENGPAFYDMDVNAETLTLEKTAVSTVPSVTSSEGDEVQPFLADEGTSWRCV
ncbi:MAG: dihydroorotase [Rhodospirillales bacterium]|jgi:dihydroorotase|nr:dihydroorotase [Rhodospirillales bacterium]MBT4038455.1 dihydroorotase [Rhodospirillales bacterium]MBT4627371.1 dihydroorotase [Rhodospirillales bacterium]MBT5350913.1 dihydroorotase [Rhodospirillales bacterium]MBT5519590.1 dihydroorotase [Rhodospirillales bacterium]